MAEEAKKKILGPGRHLSALKQNRQNEKRRPQNKAARSELRTSIKQLRQAIEAKDAKTAGELFVKTQSILDRAVKKGLMHARTSQRNIARLHRSVHSLTS